jgi:membrane associated rhomboid family serine protease
MEPSDGRFDGPPPKERIFNAPLVALLLAASMPALYWLQERSHTFWLELAFRPIDLAEGRYGGLLTYMLLHGSWLHMAMNAVGIVTFGPPLARRFGGPAGVLIFLAFYIACGMAAALGYGLLHWGNPSFVVGASGALFGLIGAAMRMLGGGKTLLSLTSRPVILVSLVWMTVNAGLGLIGFAPGADGAQVAWEAHAFGYLFGTLAIGPAVRFFGRADERFDSRPEPGDPRP